MGEVIPIDNKPQPLVKASVVADYLSCSEATILRQARAGILPARKITNGRRVHWRFDLQEVLHFYESQAAQRVG